MGGSLMPGHGDIRGEKRRWSLLGLKEALWDSANLHRWWIYIACITMCLCLNCLLLLRDFMLPEAKLSRMLCGLMLVKDHVSPISQYAKLCLLRLSRLSIPIDWVRFGWYFWKIYIAIYFLIFSYVSGQSFRVLS